ALADDLRLQGGEAGDGLGQVHRAEVGVGVVAGAEGQQGAALWLHVHGDLLGFLVAKANGALDDGVRRVADRLGLVWEGVAVVEVGLAAERRLRSEEHTSELQSRENLVCRLLLEKK